VTLRVGVLGGGWVGTVRHLPSYLAHPDVGSVTVYDTRPERVSRAARQGAIPWTGGLTSFLDEGFDVVSVCTTPWSHAELAIAALDRGAHVLTEKPMAMTGAEARSMIEAAERSRRLLCVCHNFLHAAAAREAAGLLPGAGPLQYGLAVQFSSHRRRLPDWYHDLPEGLLFDELPHMLYSLRHYFGGLSLSWAQASPSTEREPRVVELHFNGDVPAQLTTVFGSPVSEWHISLVGTNAIVDLDLFRDFAIRIDSDDEHGPSDIFRSSAATTMRHWKGFVRSGARFVRGRESWGHQQLISAFVDAVLGRRSIPVSPSDALAVVDLTDGVLRALAENRHQRLL
jgi:predicted dehydrogenase